MFNWRQIQHQLVIFGRGSRNAIAWHNDSFTQGETKCYHLSTKGAPNQGSGLGSAPNQGSGLRRTMITDESAFRRLVAGTLPYGRVHTPQMAKSWQWQSDKVTLRTYHIHTAPRILWVYYNIYYNKNSIPLKMHTSHHPNVTMSRCHDFNVPVWSIKKRETSYSSAFQVLSWKWLKRGLNKKSAKMFGHVGKKSYLCRAFAYGKACDN